MSSYVVGQRFVSEAEPEIGLGCVEEIANRRVLVRFPASDTVRQYASGSAPIKRVAFRIGDEVEDDAGRKFRVDNVDEAEGILVYRGMGQSLAETELAGTLRFSKPEERLLGGHWDAIRTFDLRRRTLMRQHEMRKSLARGFLGARIELIPHQLYISREIATRPLPRALLADEVGLGKTIEAGLIMHRLLRSGQISRVLILVPEPLVHQWFVEMVMGKELRRLVALAEVNDHVRPEEIERARVEIEELDEVIGSASLRLDALRLIWKTASPPES